MGSNIGDRAGYLHSALELLMRRVGEMKAVSSVYETEAWGEIMQDDYLNMVVKMQTKLEPQVLMQTLQSIELELGRLKKEKWKERIIDIDILFYDQMIYSATDLTIPHPYMEFRLFVLVPLNEIAPELLHPVLKKNMKTILKECKDTLAVKELEVIPNR